MVEEVKVPTDDEMTIIQACASLYEREGQDWLPVSMLRDIMTAADTTLADFTRMMATFGESYSVREYDDKKQRGFTVGQFLQPLESYHEAQREKEQQGHGHDLNECARLLLEHVRALDPDWGMLIDILKDVRGFDDRLAAISLLSYPLEHRLHLDIAPRDFLQEQPTWEPGEKVCTICGEPYTMAYPGQPPVCLKSACGRAYHGQSVPQETEIIAEEDAIPEVPITSHSIGEYVDPAFVE